MATTSELDAALVPARLLKRPEVAEFLGVSEDTVDNLASAGELECLHIGRALRFPSWAVAAYVQKRLEAESAA